MRLRVPTARRAHPPSVLDSGHLASLADGVRRGQLCGAARPGFVGLAARAGFAIGCFSGGRLDQAKPLSQSRCFAMTRNLLLRRKPFVRKVSGAVTAPVSTLAGRRPRRQARNVLNTDSRGRSGSCLRYSGETCRPADGVTRPPVSTAVSGNARDADHAIEKLTFIVEKALAS